MVLYLLDLFGVAVFAVSGALAAGRKNMDLLGVLVVATATAIGGGTIRDVMIGRHPVFWMQDTAYLTVIAVVALGIPVYTRFHRVHDKALLIADALGLGTFTVIGAQIAEERHMPAIIVAVVAAITGAGGGVLRDLLCGEIPVILCQDIYATASLAGAFVYLGVRFWGVERTPAMIPAIAVVILLRLGAILWGLHLPHFALKGDGGMTPKACGKEKGS